MFLKDPDARQCDFIHGLIPMKDYEYYVVPSVERNWVLTVDCLLVLNTNERVTDFVWLLSLYCFECVGVVLLKCLIFLGGVGGLAKYISSTIKCCPFFYCQWSATLLQRIVQTARRLCNRSSREDTQIPFGGRPDRRTGIDERYGTPFELHSIVKEYREEGETRAHWMDCFALLCIVWRLYVAWRSRISDDITKIMSGVAVTWKGRPGGGDFTICHIYWRYCTVLSLVILHLSAGSVCVVLLVIFCRTLHCAHCLSWMFAILFNCWPYGQIHIQ